MGTSAASGIALISSVGSLRGFVGPSIIAAVANGSVGIYRSLALAGVSFLVQQALMLPKRGATLAGRIDGVPGELVFDPSPDKLYLIAVNAPALRMAEQLMRSSEACEPDQAEIPFDWVLDRVTGRSGSVTGLHPDRDCSLSKL